VLSPEDIVECDTTDYGCDGGELSNVWHFLQKTGTTTDDCVPYTSGEGKVSQCPLQCQNDNVKFQEYKCERGSIVEAVNPEQIKE
jgi:cathepsin B